jgi:hypothetical protein
MDKFEARRRIEALESGFRATFYLATEETFERTRRTPEAHLIAYRGV